MKPKSLKFVVLISANASNDDEFSGIVVACIEAGLDVGTPLASVGIITGAASAEVVERLRMIPGVDAVEVQRTVPADD